MFKERINAVNHCLANIGLIIIGIVLTIQANIVIPLLRIITLCALGFLFISKLVGVFIDKKHLRDNILYGLIYLVVFILIMAFPNVYTRFIALVVALYALVNAAIQLINYLIYRKQHIQGVLFSLFRFFFDFIFGIVLIVVPLVSSGLIFVLAGVYLIIFGIFNSLSWIYLLLNQKFNISISLPAVITALLPVQLYMRIKNDPKMEEYIKYEPEPSLYPLEISIYTHDGGFEAIGHMDISLNGTIYSYGLHDPEARFLMGSAGEGVLVVTDRDAFFKNSLKDGKTMIFNFQLDVDEKQIAQVQSRIDLLMKDAYPFDCKAKRQMDAGLEVTADDYISRVYLDTHCDLYKFKEGPFKTYFVFSQNCIQLADFLVRNTEIDLLMMSGVITPGAYLSFLYSLLEKNNTIVKNLVIYK